MAAISAVIMLLDKGDHLILNSDVRWNLSCFNKKSLHDLVLMLISLILQILKT